MNEERILIPFDRSCEVLKAGLCPFQGKKYEKIAKQTKQYEKKKFCVFNHLARICLKINNLQKQWVTNPCFPATLIIYLLSIAYKDFN
jgi:hypothetical protein